MAAITSKNTGLELTVRRAVHAAGFRYRLHRRDLAGRPDLVFPRFRLVVFIHGCFWHAHGCSGGHKPKTNVAYWSEKLARNVARDEKNTMLLTDLGWQVQVLRECTVQEDTCQLLDLLAEKRSMLCARERQNLRERPSASGEDTQCAN